MARKDEEDVAGEQAPRPRSLELVIGQEVGGLSRQYEPADEAEVVRAEMGRHPTSVETAG
jgi:hypothetical protein